MSQGPESITKDIKAANANKILVMCIDRDDDVGDKAGIKTPVMGRNACLEAAQRLALEDPEDADSNAIYYAIKTYEDLISRGYDAEVAVLAGDSNRGFRADEKIIAETRAVLEKFPATGSVIVSDGEDDEAVIPVVQNILPVVSVQRVVMKVSRTIEHSYAVFGKYFKMIMYDARYSKFFLGVPGTLLLITGIAAMFGYTTEIFSVLIIILASALIIRAFDIDTAWLNWTKPEPSALVRLFTMITGIVLIVASVAAGITAVSEDGVDLSVILTEPSAIGQLMAGTIPILWVGVGVMLGGIMISHILDGARREISDTLRLIALGALYPTLAQFTNVLAHGESVFTLILPLFIGLAITVVSVIILFSRYKRQRGPVEVVDRDAGGDSQAK